MPGNFTASALADGSVPTSKAAIFTAPSGVTVYVKSLTLFNMNPTTQVVIVYLRRTGTSRAVRRYELEQFQSAEVVASSGSWILESSDAIEAQATTAGAVDFTVSGVRET